MLTEQEKWEAVTHCDSACDGKFFYGVKTTGIFCRPTCKSKAPLRKNTVFFDRIDEAYAEGLRPCKRCRPDLLDYQPSRELLSQVKTVYDNYFSDRDRLASETKALSVSQSHLIRLFRQHFHTTPTEYVNTLRLKKAVTCLATAEISVLDIALIAGFGSLSSFYACFRKSFGMTPNEYRRRQKNGLNRNTAGAA